MKHVVFIPHFTQAQLEVPETCPSCGADEAAQQLLHLPSTTLTLSATAIGFVERHHIRTEDLVLSVIPLDEANARLRASAFASEREYHDTMALMGIRSQPFQGANFRAAASSRAVDT